MFNLKQGTTDKLQLITSTAATIKSLWSFTDVDTTTLNPSALDRQEAPISSAATTDIVATPASGKVRNVKDGFVYNADASLSDDVTLQLNVATTLYPIFKCTLLPGESLVFWEGHLYHYNASGGVYGAPALVPDVQTFTASGANTWTKPTTFSPKTITVKLWGAGGGGGAGASLATATVAHGGAGGGGGAYQEERYAAIDIGATVTVTIGAGGTAGAHGAAGAAGGDGGIGGNTTFGSILTAYGGGGGRGGAISAAAGGGGGGGGTSSAGAVGTTSGGVPGGPPVHGTAATGTQNSSGGEGGVGTIAVPTTNQNCAEYGGAGGGGAAATPVAGGVGGFLSLWRRRRWTGRVP
jgi:hypothetical protein